MKLSAGFYFWEIREEKKQALKLVLAVVLALESKGLYSWDQGTSVRNRKVSVSKMSIYWQRNLKSGLTHTYLAQEMFLFLDGSGCSVFLPNELGYAYWKKQKGMVHFFPWFKFCLFVLNSLSYITIPQNREIKFKPRIMVRHTQQNLTNEIVTENNRKKQTNKKRFQWNLLVCLGKRSPEAVLSPNSKKN